MTPTFSLTLCSFDPRRLTSGFQEVLLVVAEQVLISTAGIWGRSAIPTLHFHINPSAEHIFHVCAYFCSTRRRTCPNHNRFCTLSSCQSIQTCHVSTVWKTALPKISLQRVRFLTTAWMAKTVIERGLNAPVHLRFLYRLWWSLLSFHPTA